MKSSKPSSRKRALTAEEAELWAHVTRDAKALRRRRNAAQDRDDASQAMAETSNPRRPHMAADQSNAPCGSPPRPTHQPAEPRSSGTNSSSPPLARFDEKQRRKIARNGDQHIDARLDLHGMRQRQAHAALRGFLFACAARGQRNVLIITGKGTRGQLERSRDYYEEERGVLRRLVPQWLGEPEFRALVLSYTTASVRHGGEGALYVRLRKLGPAR